MKKFFVSAGFVAAGTASLHALSVIGLDSLETSKKTWNISATLRGFYDDNYSTANSGGRSSMGFEVSPRFDMAVPMQQTELGFRYIYGFYYYQDRETIGMNPVDQTHQFDLWMDHAFSERWQMRMQDSFVRAQDPRLLTADGVVTTPRRAEGNNIVNTGTITLHTDWTRRFSTELGYQNMFVNYENNGVINANGPIPFQYLGNIPSPVTINVDAVIPSLAGLLDRIEQSAWLDLRWLVNPETVVLVGGRLGLVNYVGDELISIANIYTPDLSIPGLKTFSRQQPYYSDNRDSISYAGYLGLEHAFLPNLSMNVRAGLQYTDNYNDPIGSSTSISPYAIMSASYTYSPGSYVQIGFQESQNATDIVRPDTSGRITQYQQSSVAFASINHHLTPKLLATIIANWQNSTFYEGAYANMSDTICGVGLNLTYSFTEHFSADIGYNFDDISSGIVDRSYTRSRIYMGVSADY